MGFFSSKTPQEILRENKRTLERNIREIDRERMALQAQEKRTMAEMKKLAKAGQEDAVKVMAKDVVRMRGQITNFYKVRAQMQSVAMQMQNMKSQQAMAKGMYSITQSLQVMNRQMNMPQMQRMMHEFERQSEMMEFKQEMMNDVMDDVLAADNEEERTEEMVSQVLEEVGISVGAAMANAPLTPATNTMAAANAAKDEEQDVRDLQARLDSLRAPPK